MKAYITVGLPACGKSTWAESVEGACRVERDLIRQEVCAERGVEFAWDTWDRALEDEVQRRWSEQLQDLMRRRVNIVVSDTNLNAKHRRRLAETLVASGYEVTYVFFDVPEQVCRQRNAGRGRLRVQDDAYERLRPYFESAKTGLLSEAAMIGARVISSVS